MSDVTEKVKKIIIDQLGVSAEEVKPEAKQEVEAKVDAPAAIDARVQFMQKPSLATGARQGAIAMHGVHGPIAPPAAWGLHHTKK